ncbi:MAG: hypothetical protein H6891_02985 [Brucellaceae bacterium]|nr:hypothetical protein [Brucellaceae bacterium]
MTVTEVVRLAYGEGIEPGFRPGRERSAGPAGEPVAAGYYINFSYPELFAASN